MARIEAPAGAKAAGNSYSPEPVVTAPVVDSTFLGRLADNGGRREGVLGVVISLAGNACAKVCRFRAR
jgi:hypothetical protein